MDGMEHFRDPAAGAARLLRDNAFHIDDGGNEGGDGMIQESIRQLCAVSIFCGAAINITPEGGVRRIMQLLCTAALTIAILSPIKEIDFDIYALETARLREAEAAINESAERIDDRLNRAVIEEQCEEYILDKAEELGADVSVVKVQAQWNLDGLWVPYSAEINAPDTGGAKAALEGVIENELGIPAERQMWM